MKNGIYLIALLTTGLMLSCFQSSYHQETQGNPLKMISKGHDVFVVNQTIEETLDFSTITTISDQSYVIRGSIEFRNCVFEKDVIWENKKGGRWEFDRDVKFINCEFKGEFRANDAIYRGRFIIVEGVFHQDLDLQRCTFMNAVRITQSTTGNDLVLQYSRFYHDLQALDNKIGRNVMMQGVSVHGKSQIGNIECHGGWDLSQGHFHEKFSANYAKIGGKLWMTNTVFVGDFSMLDVEIEGPISAIKTSFLTHRQSDFEEKVNKKGH